MSTTKTARQKTAPVATKPRADYYRDRNERIVSFVLDDIELKDKLKEVADADGRSVNGWITHHMLPKLSQEIDAQLAKRPKAR